MALVLDALVGILKRPTLVGVFWEVFLFSIPLWVAIVFGLVVGWAWKPNWAVGLVADPSLTTSTSDSDHKVPVLEEESSERLAKREVESGNLVVKTEDLMHLQQLVAGIDGSPSWIPMMDRSLPTMRYKAWRRDPKTGPPQYRSSTIFEDASSETVRDFFWDDEFRTKSKWDDMLIHHKTLEECPMTGTMIVHWVRKFPFFCSDREYIIGRRIWQSGNSYYCVTKGVPCPSVPRRNTPRRVDDYYSSWLIRPVESMRGDGQMTSCEVLLFHQEDMGIPWEIAKFGVRQGMWGAVRKIDPGFRAYEKEIKENTASRKCAQTSKMTKISIESPRRMEGNGNENEYKDKQCKLNLPKLLIIGGAVILAFTFNRGLVTKAATVGVASRFARVGR